MSKNKNNVKKLIKPGSVEAVLEQAGAIDLEHCFFVGIDKDGGCYISASGEMEADFAALMKINLDVWFHDFWKEMME